MSRRGFTLLEMIVATTIMAVAIVGLLAGLSGTTRNAARLQDYDRAVQLGRERMNELLLDAGMPHNTEVSGVFDPRLTGGVESGWHARLSDFEMPPMLRPGEASLDRLQLEVWWKSGARTRTFSLDAYKPHVLTPQEVAAAQMAQMAGAAK